MKPDIMLMGICHPGKLAYLNQSLDSVDPIQSIFNKKILAIDQFNGHVFPQPFKKKFTTKNWQILIDNHSSRPKSVLHALNESESDWVFYTEDDIVLQIPNDFDLNKFDIEIDDRKLGMLSLNYGGGELNFKNKDLADLSYLEKNIYVSDEKLICFVRDEELNDGHFFEFPGVFVKKELFKACIEDCLKNYVGHQIERALTFSWFNLKYHEKYYKASVLRKEFLEYRYDYSVISLNKGRFFEAIDPLQGQFAYGGRTEC